MNKSEERLFREYERELDEHHKSLPLWGRSRPEAVYAVMTVPDSIFLVMAMAPAQPAVTGSLSQSVKVAVDGVSQALNWLTAEDDTKVRSLSDHNLIEQAHEFAIHASNYVDIADFHMMLGRGWANAHVNGESKTVTFDAISGPGQSDALAWYEQVREQSNRGMVLGLKLKPQNVLRAQEKLAAIKYDLVDGHIELGEFPVDLADIVRDGFPTTIDFELLPLPLDADMLGFTVREYRSFVEAVMIWSQAAITRYIRCACKGIPQYECMPTQIVPEREFAIRVAKLSQLPPDKVNAIRERLTYRPHAKGNFLLTPFIVGDGTVSWSPAVVINYRHERNLLKIMARGPKALSDHAATVNGARDRPLGRLIGEEFAKRGYQFKLDTPIAANGESTDVDVLLYNASYAHEVLIVEAKALVASDEINEVHSATQTLIEAQMQARCAMRILDNTPTAEKRSKFKFVEWDKVVRIYGVVVSSDVEPHAVLDPQEIPALSYNTLRWRFTRRDFRSPSRFWNACLSRSWQEREVTERRAGYRSVQIADLTYRLPLSELEHRADTLDIDGAKQ